MLRVPVAIVGASGYTGAELLRLLLRHPYVDVVGLYAKRAAGTSLTEIYPQFRGLLDIEIKAFDADDIAASAEIVFTALPHGASASVCAELYERGIAVIDLSADFRLSADKYEAWYGRGHSALGLLDDAVYGLPELNREALAGARLIAVAGCYPTSAVLALAPLLEAGVVASDRIIVDAKSGVSGSGRSPSLAAHFPEASGGIRAYKVAGTHRHTGEIEQELAHVVGQHVPVTFTPHLVPMSRGIACVAYGVAGPRADEAQAVLEAAYADEPFVSVLPAGRNPDTAHVRGSNHVHTAVMLDRRTNTVLAMSAIDNLIKGASGQAVQCMNASRAWDETLGLDAIALFP